MYLHRLEENRIRERLKTVPVVALIGPRQCGKSTLSKYLLSDMKSSLYLDLELPSDLRKLDDPELFFNHNSKSLICLDEVQRKPDLFPVLRAICDRNERPGQFLILGSASPDLLRQSSETLAGRISYINLTPFQIMELDYKAAQKHWCRGGFPGSWLPEQEQTSVQWRTDFISTYLEKDVPSLGFTVSSQTVRRLWTMLAHSTGQPVNMSQLGNSLGISSPTVKSYIEILEKTFMVRILQPYFENTKKRLIKTPKAYIRDTGILHTLLNIENTNQLFGHPVSGQSWEAYAIEQIISSLPEWFPYFYRTSDGSEIDLLLIKGQQKVAIECKASTSPKIGPGFYHCVNDLNIDRLFVASPLQNSEQYPLKQGAMVASIDQIIRSLSA